MERMPKNMLKESFWPLSFFSRLDSWTMSTNIGYHLVHEDDHVILRMLAREIIFEGKTYKPDQFESLIEEIGSEEEIIMHLHDDLIGEDDCYDCPNSDDKTVTKPLEICEIISTIVFYYKNDRSIKVKSSSSGCSYLVNIAVGKAFDDGCKPIDVASIKTADAWIAKLILESRWPSIGSACKLAIYKDCCT